MTSTAQLWNLRLREVAAIRLLVWESDPAQMAAESGWGPLCFLGSWQPLLEWTWPALEVRVGLG